MQYGSVQADSLQIFHTSGPLAGTEMEFPASNNAIKKYRSINAAAQIGEFDYSSQVFYHVLRFSRTVCSEVFPC